MINAAGLNTALRGSRPKIIPMRIASGTLAYGAGTGGILVPARPDYRGHVVYKVSEVSRHLERSLLGRKLARLYGQRPAYTAPGDPGLRKCNINII